MKSLINKSNCNKIPFSIIILLIVSYICPNIRYPSVGENSFIPVFIFLLSYSLFKYKEIKIYIIFSFFCLIYPLYSSIFINQFSDYSIVSSLMSLYIITVPVISSISLGKIIALRYSKSSENKIKRELKIFLAVLFFLFIISAFLKSYAPQILYFFLHAGRTSHNRLAFFFTEPSQSSSVLLFLIYLGILFFLKNKFSLIFKGQRFYISSFIIIGGFILIYLAQPLTIFAQLAIIIFLYILLLLLYFFYNILLKRIIRLKIFNLKKSPLFYFKKLIIFSPLIIAFIYSIRSFFERVIGLISFIGNEGLFLGVMISSGNRFYYAFTSLIESIRNPISLPGDWVGKFGPSLINVLGEFSLMPPDAYGLLQLYKQQIPLVLKPSGWLFFSIYDLGIIGFLLVSFFFFRDYLKWFFIGILKCDKNVILLFSIQISILFIPLLPSTPSAFFPLLIASYLMNYKNNKKEIGV